MPVASESRELLDNRPSCLSSPISAVDFAMLRTDSIVITGMGALTCAGPSVEDLWQAALASAVQVNRGPLGLEHTTCGIAQIPQTADTQRLTRKGDRFLPLALHAANAAWQDAGLTKVDMVPERCGLIAGTSRGPINRVVALAETHRHRRPRLSSALHPQLSQWHLGNTFPHPRPSNYIIRSLYFRGRRIGHGCRTIAARQSRLHAGRRCRSSVDSLCITPNGRGRVSWSP